MRRVTKVFFHDKNRFHIIVCRTLGRSLKRCQALERPQPQRIQCLNNFVRELQRSKHKLEERGMKPPVAWKNRREESRNLSCSSSPLDLIPDPSSVSWVRHEEDQNTHKHIISCGYHNAGPTLSPNNDQHRQQAASSSSQGVTTMASSHPFIPLQPNRILYSTKKLQHLHNFYRNATGVIFLSIDMNDLPKQALTGRHRQK